MLLKYNFCPTTKSQNCWIRTLFILFFSGRSGLGISDQALLVNLSSSGCWYEAAVESTMCVTIRGSELPSFIEFMRLDSTLTGPGFTCCTSSRDVVYRTLVLLSSCNVAVLYCYSVTVARWEQGRRVLQISRRHSRVRGESNIAHLARPTIPFHPNQPHNQHQHPAMLSHNQQQHAKKNMYDASPDHKIKIMFKELWLLRI